MMCRWYFSQILAYVLGMQTNQTISILKNEDQNKTGEWVLLVEDEPTNAIILSSYLQVAGYQVEEAHDGITAWEKLVEAPGRYRLIVTDKRMPNMNGVELVSRIRADRRFSNIPVIMQTGDNSQNEFIKSINAGVYYYLTKPLDEVIFIALVRAAITERERKEIFERRLSGQSGALTNLIKGEFFIRTPEEAQNTALLLGSAFPNPELAISGVYELVLNAIEHGNLGIGYEEKGRLLADNAWEDEIERRLDMPENSQKKVIVNFEKFIDRREITIQDEGPGFDWQPYMEIEPARATHANGRGIAKAFLLSFDQVKYEDKGNRVRAIMYDSAHSRSQ